MALFPSGKRGSEQVNYGYRGKGVTIHSLVDGEGNPLAVLVTAANESEREPVLPLLASIHIQTAEAGRPRQKPKNLATDGGYDSGELGESLGRKGLGPEIAKRMWKERKQDRGRKVEKRVNRYVVERTFWWYQRKFRR